jgi:type II secretory pathway predicted ATPase ExeA
MNASALRPFAQTSDPRFLYREGSYALALADVTEGLRRREELIVVSGAAGTGKSTLCNDVLLLSRLDRAVFPSMVSDPWLSVEELLEHMLDACGVDTTKSASRHDRVTALQSFLASLPMQGARVWLIIDEAQHLRPELVEQLRLLAGGDGAASRALQILLVGQPDVEKLFDNPQLDQRIARRCELKCLGVDETRRYIEHRLHAADEPLSHTARPRMFGGVLEDAATDRFTPRAVREIAALSGGALRAIDTICDRALELASQRNVAQVDRSLVREVTRQLKIPARSLRSSSAMSAVVATALVAGIPPVAWFFAVQTPTRVAHAQVAPLPPSPASEQSGVEALRIVPAISIEAGSFTSATRADAVAARLNQLGLPALARPDFAGVSHLVIVGPYETEEETRAIQPTLTEQGFPGSRILHQQTFAPTTLESGTATAESGFPRIVAVTPDGDRVSVVIELAAAPDRVATQRISASILEIEAGPITGSVRLREVNANSATAYLDRVSLRDIVAADGRHFVRARVIMTTASRSRVRMSGRRIYVDLSSAQRPDERTPTEQERAAPHLPPANREAVVDEQYREAAGVVLARLGEIQPFLLSAAAAPSPDVLVAVGLTLSNLQSTLEGISVPQSATRDYALLKSALRGAHAAVQPDFAGDRMAKAREAAAMFEMAKEQSSARPGVAAELTVAEGPRRPK